MTLEAPDERSQPLVILLVSGLLCAIHAALFLPLLTNSAGLMGHDHASSVPNLLAGYYAYQANGALSIPWFTPAFCGGVPFYANPQVAYFSIAQLLTLAVDPVRALGATFVILTLAGFAGTYFLLLLGFGVNRWASVVGAALFAFNGFFVYRFVVGHVPFAHFALAPLIALCLVMPGGSDRGVMRGVSLPLLGAALLVAALIQAGIASILIPVMLSVLLVLVMHSLATEFSWRVYIRFAVAGLGGLCLSAAKIAAALAFVGQFPRDQYPLPGYDNPLHGAAMAFLSLFVEPPLEAHRAWTRNAVISTGRHELEFGLSVVPLVLIALALLVWLRRGMPRARRLTATRLMLFAAACLIALVPILLTWYEPDWNRLLKQLPIVGTSSTLVRWQVVYIPAIVVGAGLAMHRIGWSQPALATAALAVLLATNAGADKSFYRGQPYDPRPVVTAYSEVKTGQRRPAIANVEVVVDKDQRPMMTVDRNNSLARGNSQLLCYEPIFGYGLERFPLGALRPGPVLASVDGRQLNLKNPACYLYPRENGCAPGDQFPIERRSDAEAFAAYRSFSHRISTPQVVADAINVTAVLGVLAVALGHGLTRIRRRRQIAAAQVA